MQIRSQRLVIIFALAISLTLTGVLFLLAQRNQSEAYYELTDTGREMKIAYYINSVEKLPQSHSASDRYTLIFFSATWDAYSLRLGDMLRGQLALRSDLQIIEFDINEYSSVAYAWQAMQPPSVILVDKQGTELGRITSATSAQLDKLLTLIPSN